MRALALAAVFAAALVACTAEEPAPTMSIGEQRFTFEEQIDNALSYASSAASDDQIAIIEAARDHGFLTQAMAVQARDNFFACLTDHGVFYNDLGIDLSHEFGRIDYTHTAAPMADACYEREYSGVDSVYQTQPVSMQSRADLLAGHLSELLTCLRTDNVEIADNPTYDELRWALMGLVRTETGFEPLDGDDGSTDHTHCLEALGLDPNDVL